MTRIELASEVVIDLDRIVDHLTENESPHAVSRVETIVAAIDTLAMSPEIGRPRDRGLRELVIGRASRGYVALYRFIPELDVVVVLSVRAQREAGYDR